MTINPVLDSGGGQYENRRTTTGKKESALGLELQEE